MSTQRTPRVPDPPIDATEIGNEQSLPPERKKEGGSRLQWIWDDVIIRTQSPD